MPTDVDVFLRRLAQELRPRVNESADMLVRRVRDELPELWEHEDLANLAVEETAEHVTAFLDLLENGLDAPLARTPPAALEVARRYARSGVPVSKLLRAHRLGHIGMLRLAQDTAAGLTDDQRLVNAVWTRLMSRGFEYVDLGSEHVAAAYQEEHDRLLQRRLLLTNEASVRIGTTLDTARTCQELADVGAEGFADLVTVDLLDSVLRDEATHPSPDAGLLCRVAQRSVLEGCPDSAVATGDRHTYPTGSHPALALADSQSLLHRITASDIPVWLAPSEEQRIALRAHGFHSVLLVPLHARGHTLGLAEFFRHRTVAPFDEDDLLLAQEIASRAAVYIDNARRYTHERSTSLTLQRSLLPQRAVEQSAVETASRYLPSGSRAGVGGDWYDVIPLSGARVALVVGDVVCRGLHAAATMGRLRTAVRAFAEIDLMPDELLTHLDDVVIRLQREEASDRGETGATCLYAVYDPVSRLCSLASAGHMLPAVVVPRAADGDAPAGRVVDFPELPIGPPLGLGGLPFETTQFELPEGSLLALYTDGLVESRTRDVETARAMLCDILAEASGTGPAGTTESPDEVCDRVLDTLLPSRSSDDVALLVARTRALDPGQVATLDVPSDPAAVSGARAFTSEQLTAWGLEELSFVTELIVSELVTNAIRYGESPIRLRLILQSTLTCEVSDAGSTAPHLRRARTFDEGGRGLLLVAQHTVRWGTRHNREGKTIWAEQALPGEGDAPGSM